MKFIKRFWGLIFIFLVWFIFSSPYFLKGLVPYSSTYQVNFFPPWSSYDKFHSPIKNNAMPDITDEIYPWRHFTIETWRSGQIPFWNPNSFSGNPHLANYQSAVLSPLNLLFFIFSFIDAWSLNVLFAPLFAGFFTYLLLRELKVGKSGSIISAISFMFCGFMVVWMAYTTLSWAIAFLPLALFSIERWFNKRDKLSLLLLSVSTVLSFFSGHFQTSLYFLIFTLLFLVFKIALVRRNYAPLIISFGIGFLISLLQIVPSVQFYFESSRSGIFNQGGGIPFFYLINIFSPDFFGNPVTRNDWLGYYAEWASFIGIVPLTLSIFSIEKKNKTVLFFLISGIIFLLLAINSPLQQVINNLKIPVVSTSNSNRIIVLFSFAFSVLSGLGFEKLIELVRKRNIKKIIPVFLGVSLLFILIWILLLFLHVLPKDKAIIGERNFVLPTMIFFLFLFISLISLYKNKLLIYAILLLVSFDSLRFVQKWMPFDPKNLVFPDTPIVTGMEKNIGYGRIFGNFLANVDTYYNLPSVEGYDPLYIERYGEFIRSADFGKFEEPERSVVKLARRGYGTDRVLDLLGVSLIFNPIADTNQNWAYPVWSNHKRFGVIFEDSKFQIFKNETALERAKLFYSFEVINNKQKEIKRFYSPDFDFRNKLLLEEQPGVGLTYGKGTAKIISYTPDKVQISVETSTPAFLFLSDNYYPGWRAKVNGREVRIYRADYSFRAVIVTKGKSTVEFSFVPGF